MGTISSTSAGLADLLQALSKSSSPLLSTFSSTAVQSALKDASASDIAEISNQALQLQVADSLFGDPNSSNTGQGSLFAVLAAIDSKSGNSGGSLANQVAAYQANSQIQESQALLGIASPIGQQSSLFDFLA
jgi:hypothetical protein